AGLPQLTWRGSSLVDVTERPAVTAASAAVPSRLASLLIIVNEYPASTAARTDAALAPPALPIGTPAAAASRMAPAMRATTCGSDSALPSLVDRSAAPMRSA